jgi:hypothetical protein
MKKASMSLSINAIVVIVLAFVMLGLGLSLTTGIFNSIKIPEMPNPGLKASVDNPLALPDEISVKRKGSLQMNNVEFYNKGDDIELRQITFTNCINPDTGSAVEVGATNSPPQLPRVTISPLPLKSGEITKLKLLLKENELSAGKTYLCTLELRTSPNSDGTASAPIHTQSLFLKVTA